MNLALSIRLPLLAALLICAGCGPKLIKTEVFRSDNKQVRVELRHTREGGEVVSKGYDHPATVAAVRLAHILATITFEDSDEGEKSAIRSEHLYLLADGLNQALAQAGPGDEVVAAALSQDRSLGIFTKDRATSFRIVFIDDQMHLSFYAIEKHLEKPGVADEIKEYQIPTEFPARRPAFKLIPGKAQATSGPRTLVVDWRSPVYRKALRLGRAGRGLRRRQVLMELPEEEEEAQGRAALDRGRVRVRAVRQAQGLHEAVQGPRQREARLPALGALRGLAQPVRVRAGAGRGARRRREPGRLHGRPAQVPRGRGRRARVHPLSLP